VKISYDTLSTRLNDRANLQKKLLACLIRYVFIYQSCRLVTADQIKLYAMLATD